MWNRNCPKCSNEINYKFKSNWYKANRHNSSCSSCSSKGQNQGKTYEEIMGKEKAEEVKMGASKRMTTNNIAKSKKVRKKISDSLKGNMNCKDRKLSKEHIEILRQNGLKTVMTNEKKELISSSVKKYRDALTKNELDELNKKSYEKSILCKFGLSIEEYTESISEFKRYKMDVCNITKKQPIHLLEHIEKRGRAGIKGSYQLDHKISIFNGFHSNTPKEIIGDISNLQMITWEENLKKGIKNG